MKSVTKSEWEVINKYRRLFDRDCKVDVVNLNTHNSTNHELTKTYVCLELARQDRHFLTEAKFTFKNKSGRADIVDLTTGRIIEIFESETEESLDEKRLTYPLMVFAIKARSVLKP